MRALLGNAAICHRSIRMGILHPMLFATVVILGQMQHMGHIVVSGQSSVVDKGCESFDAGKYLKPYNESEEAMMTDLYFGELQSVSVVYAQRGSCEHHSECLRASASAFSTCLALRTISECTGNDGWPMVLFDNCSGNLCEFTMDPNVTICNYARWRKIPLAASEPCIFNPDDNVLEYRSLENLKATNGSHCLLPAPRGSKIYEQIKCMGRMSDEPYLTWSYKFSTPLFEDKYSCLLLSRCEGMESPLDLVCISGDDSAKILGQAAKLRMLSEGLSDDVRVPESSGFIMSVETGHVENMGSEWRPFAAVSLLSLCACYVAQVLL